MAQILKPNRLDNRGGKRPNAGRPTTERKPFQVRCRPENINEIRIWIKTNKL